MAKYSLTARKKCGTACGLSCDVYEFATLDVHLIMR